MMSHRKCQLISAALVFLTIPFLLAHAQDDANETDYEALIVFEEKYHLWNVVTGRLTELPDLEVLQYSSPKWSPDGNRLALVLSKTGAPKIYVLDLNTKHLSQITFGSSIDTEPFWLADGQNIVFTSNMGGKPQIHKFHLLKNKLNI